MVQKGFFFVVLCLVAALAPSAQAQFFRSSSSVKEISAKQLHQLLLDRNQVVKAAKEQGMEPPPADFVLVDVREAEEYEVSVIPGAITKAQFERDAEEFAGLTIIPYCTVGGRSTQYAKQLAAKGAKVLNFKESIIGWCNAKLPLVTTAGKSTNRVHTYSSWNRVPSSYKAVH